MHFIIVTVILLILIIIGHTIYVLIRYLFDTSFEIYYSNIKYKYRRILIHIADRFYIKDGGFWKKFVGHSLMEKIPEQATFIIKNTNPEIQFSPTLNNLSWIHNNELIQANNKKNLNMEFGGNPYQLFYGRDFWGESWKKQWLISLNTEYLIIVFSIKEIIRWLMVKEFIPLDYKNRGLFVPEYNQEKIKARYDWEDSRKRIINLDKATKGKKYVYAVSKKDKIYRITDKDFLNQICDILFYCSPLRSISSIECNACQRKYNGNELQDRYYKGSYWSPDTGYYIGLSFCLRFIICPHQHILLSVHKVADLS